MVLFICDEYQEFVTANDSGFYGLSYFVGVGSGAINMILDVSNTNLKINFGYNMSNNKVNCK